MHIWLNSIYLSLTLKVNNTDPSRRCIASTGSTLVLCLCCLWFLLLLISEYIMTRCLFEARSCCCSVFNSPLITGNQNILQTLSLSSTLGTEAGGDHHVLARRPHPSDEICPGIFWCSPRHGEYPDTSESSRVGLRVQNHSKWVVSLVNLLKAPFVYLQLVPVWESPLCGQYRSIVRMIGTNLPLTPYPRLRFQVQWHAYWSEYSVMQL